ncbi:MAG: hypothetical protein MJK04_13125 [Psychrosphaera sp.]|nr:hypothetical protein [Psychrosphaera sp.]
MKIVILMIGLMLSFPSIAGKYTGAAKITRFSNIDSTGSFVIIGGWDGTKTDGCTNTTKWIVGLHSNFSTAESVSSAMSMIMAAYVANKTVEFYVDGCNTAGQPIISAIWFPSRS